MAGSEEVNCRPRKIQKLEKACEGSKSSWERLKIGEVDDDEYLRQYLLFHYQFQKSEGFMVDWERFDYAFHVQSFDDSPPFSQTRSNAVLIREMTLLAIEKHNEAQGTKLVFVEHISANFEIVNGLLCWLTFWARDTAALTPESKIYQAKVWRREKQSALPMFRLKPNDEEMDSIEVKPPTPIRYDFCTDSCSSYCFSNQVSDADKYILLFEYKRNNDKPPIVFVRAGPEDGVPFVFDRTGALLDCDSSGFCWSLKEKDTN